MSYPQCIINVEITRVEVLADLVAALSSFQNTGGRKSFQNCLGILYKTGKSSQKHLIMDRKESEICTFAFFSRVFLLILQVKYSLLYIQAGNNFVET